LPVCPCILARFWSGAIEESDESIGSIYIKAKPNPFLCNTEYDEITNILKKKYHIKMEGSDIIVIEDCKEIYKGNPVKLPKNIENIIKLENSGLWSEDNYYNFVNIMSSEGYIEEKETQVLNAYSNDYLMTIKSAKKILYYCNNNIAINR
jgi:hypothetical protein